MKIAVLVPFAPLLGLLLVPWLGGRVRSGALAVIALVPATLLFADPAADLSWVLLGSSVALAPGLAEAAALQSLGFALVFLLSARESACPRAGDGALLLAHGALLLALLANDLLLMLSGFTVAGYAVLCARLCAGPLPGGRLASVVLLLVLGDLAAFELVLLLAKAAGKALVPTLGDTLGALSGSAFTGAMAALVALSRGAVLVLARRGMRGIFPPASVALLVLPMLAWRLQGIESALAAVFLVLLGVPTTIGLAGPLARLLSALRRWALRTEAPGLPSPGGWFRRLPELAGRGEVLVGSWGAALAGLVLLALLILLASAIGT